jgi:CBS-domain-containing membrane protein
MRSLVKDLMTTPAVTVGPATPFKEIVARATAAEAARRMHTAKVKRLPVVGQGGRLVGILSRGDLLKVFDCSGAAIRREIIEDVIVGEFMMAPSRFFLRVTDGVVVLQGRVERRSLLPYVLRAVQGSRAWSGWRTGWRMTSTTVTPINC